ncbi:MAG: NusA-like transcription termination signal-binding factor [Candidatus Diapherotrites archaeon]|nr:NusA-like transcription termination signal-binding factor [Candidatus Diapherotrites archaeon]
MKLENDSIKLISLFKDITGIFPKDCVKFDDALVFIVNKGEAGGAIGKGGSNIRRVKEKLKNSNVLIFEYSSNAEEMVKNLLFPAEVTKVNIKTLNNEKIANVFLKSTERAQAIGKNGSRIKKAKELLLRHHNICDIKLQ